MPSFTETAIKLYRRLFGTPAVAGQLADGISTVLDGNTAVAITEACIADTAALCGTAFGSGAGVAWQSEQQRSGNNMFGGMLDSHDAEGARGAIAAATGLAMTGQRGTVFLSGQEIAAAQDLLLSLSGRHLPLVLHLEARAPAAQGAAIGSGHEAVHLSADSGCFTLFAGNVQQAVDFTLIARRLAELSLIPGVVAMDAEQTASGGQEVALPSPALVREFIGQSNDDIAAPNEAQQLLFGETRRRVPRWHDLDSPTLHGALQDSQSFALGAAARMPWFESALSAHMEQAFSEFARLTGRHYSAVFCHNIDKARRVLVAQGSAIESAVAVAEHLRKNEKLKVGVIGLHSLRPFPGTKLVELLSGKENVTVLERLAPPLSGETPLLRELRSAFERAQENQRYGGDTHPGYPALEPGACPRLCAASYGMGGLPLRSTDLIALARSAEQSAPALRYLGIEFHRNDTRYPKRQAMLDTLRRHYPDIAKLGLRSDEATPDMRPADAFSLAIQRLSGDEVEGMAVDAASFLHQLLGGQVRSRPALSWERWGTALVERVSHASGYPGDCSEESPVDCIMVADRGAALTLQALQPLQPLLSNGLLILDGITAFDELPSVIQNTARGRQLQIFSSCPLSDAESGTERKERLLGALFAAMLAGERLDIKPRRLRAARDEALSHLDESQRRSLLSAFEFGLENTQQLEHIDTQATTNASAAYDDTAPLAVRHLGANTARYDSLPRFWDQIGVLYKNADTGALTADPYLATGSIPPISAAFRDHSPARRALPQFQPQHCSACGKCWSTCPDSAIGATAMSPRALVETGITLASTTELRSIAGKLATAIATLSRKGEIATGSAGQLLAEAYTWLQDKSPVAEDRREAIESAIGRMQEALADLPLSITDPLFNVAEQRHKDSGELLALAINPASCKGCALCTDLCADGALTMQPSDDSSAEIARRQWQLWQQTPDTSSATIERLVRDAAMDPMAALMLSRHCAFALSGGDAAEAGSGEKIAVRQVLAATEYQQQPLLHRFIQELGTAQAALSGKIRESLAEALPGEDLDQLAANLQKIHTREVNLSAFVQAGEQVSEGSGVDAVKLRKLIALTRGIAELHWRISRGEHGLGRARYGLTFAPGTAAAWAGAFPCNPFHAPVTLDMTGTAPQLAAGLLHGQLNEALEAIRLLRQARTELDPKSPSDVSTSISWQDLSDEERGLIPPLILIGNDQSLGGEGFAQVAWLLNSGLPIKILVLAELDFGLGNRNVQSTVLNAQKDARGELALMALAQRNAYVAQSSFAAPEHLRESVRGMLRFAGPALLRLHAPSPERHGFPASETLAQAHLAVESRTLPLFRYDPQAEGVFGSRLNLDGNPAPREPWACDEAANPVTPVNWALREKRFAPRLRPLQKDAPAPTALQDWLALDATKRQGKTPFIIHHDELGNEHRRAVDTELAKLVARQHHAWRTLQEIAGLVTPFTARVEAEAEEKLAAAHQAELDALRSEYEEKLRALEESMHSEMHQQITHRLMELAGYDG